MSNNLINEQGLQETINSIKQQLVLHNGQTSLSLELEAILKNLPSYFKIVKGHIGELRKILTKNQQDFASVMSGTSTQKIIKLFEEVQIEDLPLLEEIAYMARTYNMARIETR